MTQKRSSSGRPRVAASVLELIGGTPLVKLNRIPKPEGATVLAKAESLNPAGSVKDRIAYAMVGRIIGYPVEIVIPDNASAERKKRMLAHGVPRQEEGHQRQVDDVRGPIIGLGLRHAENPRRHARLQPRRRRRARRPSA